MVVPRAQGLVRLLFSSPWGNGGEWLFFIEYDGSSIVIPRCGFLVSYTFSASTVPPFRADMCIFAGQMTCVRHPTHDKVRKQKDVISIDVFWTIRDNPFSTSQ